MGKALPSSMKSIKQQTDIWTVKAKVLQNICGVPFLQSSCFSPMSTRFVELVFASATGACPPFPDTSLFGLQRRWTWRVSLPPSIVAAKRFSEMFRTRRVVAPVGEFSLLLVVHLYICSSMYVKILKGLQKWFSRAGWKGAQSLRWRRGSHFHWSLYVLVLGYVEFTFIYYVACTVRSVYCPDMGCPRREVIRGRNDMMTICEGLVPSDDWFQAVQGAFYFDSGSLLSSNVLPSDRSANPQTARNACFLLHFLWRSLKMNS